MNAKIAEARSKMLLQLNFRSSLFSLTLPFSLDTQALVS